LQLVQVNHDNATRIWSGTIEAQLKNSKNAVMVYTGAGHVDIHDKFGLVSLLNIGHTITDEKHMSFF